jgi:hypothetical protein
MSVITNSLKLVFVLLVFATAPAYAKSASETAKEFYNLLKQNNYSAAAEYYDPAALREFRKLMSFENEIPEGRRKIYFKTFFVPALTDDSISTLSDHDFFVSFWRGILTSERFSGEIKFDDVKILGVVMEGEDLAHVVIRNRISVAEHEVESVEVTTFGKFGSQWKVKMSGKLKVIALTLRWEFTH